METGCILRSRSSRIVEFDVSCRITGSRNGGRDTPVLTIGNAILSDAGVYACTAKNEYGQTRQAMFLSVVPIPKMRREYVVKVGDQLRLPCADESGGEIKMGMYNIFCHKPLRF